MSIEHSLNKTIAQIWEDKYVYLCIKGTLHGQKSKLDNYCKIYTTMRRNQSMTHAGTIILGR